MLTRCFFFGSIGPVLMIWVYARSRPTVPEPVTLEGSRSMSAKALLPLERRGRPWPRARIADVQVAVGCAVASTNDPAVDGSGGLRLDRDRKFERSGGGDRERLVADCDVLEVIVDAEVSSNMEGHRAHGEFTIWLLATRTSRRQFEWPEDVRPLRLVFRGVL